MEINICGVKRRYLIQVMHWWTQVIRYYTTIGQQYHVNPLIFVGIHVVATPIFAFMVAWIIYNKKANKSIIFPSLGAILIFNAANIYLVLFGTNIPWWVYGIVASLATTSGYIAFIKIRKKLMQTKL
jgi:hypothetical protein